MSLLEHCPRCFRRGLVFIRAYSSVRVSGGHLISCSPDTDVLTWCYLKYQQGLRSGNPQWTQVWKTADMLGHLLGSSQWHARAKSLNFDFAQNILLSSVLEIVWQILYTIHKDYVKPLCCTWSHRSTDYIKWNSTGVTSYVCDKTL